MEIQDIHKKLDKQCPSDYRINEIITFAYPYRRVRIKATVNKSPEKSIQQVYSVLIRSILVGNNTDDKLINFLGLHKEDFLLRELYFLRERGFIDLASGVWLVTEQGHEFIKDNSILKILEEEEYEFLIDGLTDEALEKSFNTFKVGKNDNKLDFEISYPNRSPELIANKHQQIADIYKKEHNRKAYLVDYDKNNIEFDSADREFKEYCLVEYIPRANRENELEPRIEIRNLDKDVSLEKRLTKILSEKYPSILYQFTNSERSSVAKIQQENEYVSEQFIEKEVKQSNETQMLSIWETQAKFKEALQSVKKAILIESPWIKRATLDYIKDMENALKRNVQIVILYGIESNDEHHRKAEKEMERLNSQYKNFHLIHLPTHFEKQGNYKMTGTHRKLIIKDNDYFIQGSFNFLSFNKKEGQKVANEESILITENVKNKWKQVIDEYQLNEKKQCNTDR